jgi:hypothetical protein
MEGSMILVTSSTISHKRRRKIEPTMAGIKPNPKTYHNPASTNPDKK